MYGSLFYKSKLQALLIAHLMVNIQTSKTKQILKICERTGFHVQYLYNTIYCMTYVNIYRSGKDAKNSFKYCILKTSNVLLLSRDI